MQIEVKYSEAFSALSHPLSDGPYTFKTALSNSFRVETYNVTTTGRFTAPLIQGGQRWQTIELLTGTNVTFDLVALVATADTTDVADFPGAFNTSDDELNAIWGLGAKAAAVACVEKGTQGAIWEVDSVKGALVRSTRPAVTVNGSNFAYYTLEFDTMIERGGVWWNVASSLSLIYNNIQLMLVSNLPPETTFVNTNTTVTPANSLVLAYGTGFVNQTTLTSYYLDAFTIPFDVTEHTWHRVSTALAANGYISASVDSHQIFNVSLADYYIGGTTATLDGSFGFGGWQDQSAYVRNVTAFDTSNGTLLYQNPMTSSATVLAEYGAQANLASVCLDGAKRDRLVWLGDFYHTAKIIGVSTARHDLSEGTLAFLLATQISDGELNISPIMGYDPANSQVFAALGMFFFIEDYQFLGLGALYSHVQMTGDLSFVAQNWDAWKRNVGYLTDNIDTTGDGLVHIPLAFLGPAASGSAVSCLGVQALRQMAILAGGLNDTAAQASWTVAADALADAVNAQLWNDDLGVFGLSTSSLDDFSVASTAFCISSGVANATQAARSLAAVQTQLKLWPGYRDSTQADPSDPGTNISPNTNGFLLDALFMAAEQAQGTALTNSTATSNTTLVAMGSELIRSLWGVMASNESTRSGASWEYVSQTGDPGLQRFTSLAHPWGGAATYVLTERVLGIRPVQGLDGFGHKSWVIRPETGVEMGLTSTSGKVETPYGSLAVSWAIDGGALQVNVSAPEGTTGTIVYKGKVVDVEGGKNSSVTVRG